MSYGREALKDEKKLELKQSLDYTKNQYDIYNFGTAEWGQYSVPREEYYRRAEIRTEEVLKQAYKRESLSERLEASTMSLERSSWLTSEEIPLQAEIDKQMDDATKAMELKTLSKSQKTKRGEKFNEKAKRQAGMMRQLRAYNMGWQHSLAAALRAGIKDEGDNMEDPKSLYEDTAHLDETGTMLTDIANYAVWKNYAQKRGDRLGGKDFLDKQASVTYKDIVELANENTYKKQCVKMIDDFKDLDLDDFNYKSDEEFMKDFSGKYAALKAFSHIETMLNAPGVKDSIKDIEIIKNKVIVLKDILSDYENRATMIQSPYYVLLAGKDIDSLSDKDLQRRILTTEDKVAKQYMQKVLERRKYITFGKGVSAKKLEKRAQVIAGKKSAQANDLIRENMEKDIELMEVRQTQMEAYRQMEDEMPEEIRDALALVHMGEDAADAFEEHLKSPALAKVMKVSNVPFLDHYKDLAPSNISAITKINGLLGINNLTTELPLNANAYLAVVPREVLESYIEKNRELVRFQNQYKAVVAFNKWNGDYKDMPEQEKVKRQKLDAAVNFYKNEFVKDTVYQTLCKEYIDLAKQIRESIFTASFKDGKFDSMGDLSGTEIVDNNKGKGLGALYKRMYGGLTWTHGYEMPEEAPVEEARLFRRYMFERNLDVWDNDSKEKIQRKYKKKLKMARNVRSWMENEENVSVKKKEDYTYLRRFKVGESEVSVTLREEFDVMDNLNMEGLNEVERVEKEKSFIGACAKFKHDPAHLSIEERKTILDGYEEMFRRIETELVDPTTHVLKSRDDFFKDEETFKRWSRDIAAGFNIKYALDTFAKVGGVMSDERRHKLYSISSIYETMQQYFTSCKKIAITPEAMFIDKKDIDNMTPEDAVRLNAKLTASKNHSSGTENDKMFGRWAMSEDLMHIITYEKKAPNALGDYIDKKKGIDVDRIIKESMAKSKLTIEREKLRIRQENNIIGDNTIKKAILKSREIEDGFEKEKWNLLSAKLKEHQRHPHFIRRKYEKPEYEGLVNLKYMYRTKTMISDIKNENGYIIDEVHGERSTTEAIYGLLNQFRETDIRKYDKLDSNSNDIKAPLIKTKAWKQFGNMGDLPSDTERTIARYAKTVYDVLDLLRLAKNLDTYIRTDFSKEPEVIGDEKAKKEVYPIGEGKRFTPEYYLKDENDVKLYKDIMTFAKKLDGVMEALTSEDEAEQAVAHEYLQTLTIVDQINAKPSRADKKWIMPAVGPSFKEYKEANAKERTTMISQCYVNADKALKETEKKNEE